MRDFFKRLLRHSFTGSTYVVGEAGLIGSVRAAYASAPPSVGGVVVAGDERLPPNANPVQYVAIGSQWEPSTRQLEQVRCNVYPFFDLLAHSYSFFRLFSHSRLQLKACVHVRNGARLVYPCPDAYDVLPDGNFAFGYPIVPVKLLEQVTGCSSYNLGKPNPHMLRMGYNLLWRQKQLQYKDVLFVGDSIGTDIRTAIENGIDCVLVLSGTTSREKLARSAFQVNLNNFF